MASGEPRFALRSFDEILRDVHAAQAWYESLHILTTGTRLEQIESSVQDLQNDLKSLPHEKVVKRWSNAETYYVLNDGAGFGAIAREIAKVSPNLLPRHNLLRILKGPLLLGDEVPSQGDADARNIFVELELAAKVSEKGLPLLGFDDLQFRFEGRRYHVQCKRLHSTAGVQENVEKAYRQLGKTMSTDDDRGLVALAIEKVLGLDDGTALVVGPDFSLNDEVNRLTTHFRAQFEDSWNRFVDTRVIAVVVILRFLCHTVSYNVVGPAYYLSLIPLASAGTLQAAEVSRIQALVAHLI